MFTQRIRIGVLVAAAAAAAAAAATAEDAPPPAAKPGEADIERRVGEGRVVAVAVSPDGKFVAASDDSGLLAVFSTDSDKASNSGAADVQGRRSRTDPSAWLVFTSDSRFVLAATENARGGRLTVQVVSAVDGKLVRTIDAFTDADREKRTTFDDDLLDVWVQPGSSRFVLARRYEDQSWDAESGDKTDSKPNEPLVSRRVLSRDGAMTACGRGASFWVVSKDKSKSNLHVDLTKSDILPNGTLTGVDATVIGFTSDARLLIVESGAWKKTKRDAPSESVGSERIEAYSVADGSVAWRHDVPGYMARGRFVAAGKLVSYLDDGKLVMLNADTGQVREKVKSKRRFSCVAATPDGQSFWAGCEDGRVVCAKSFGVAKTK